MLKIMLLSALVSIALADVSHIVDYAESTTFQPRPYQFSYSAGRAPGHTDRSHAEVGDGAGTVRGAFSYVDPRNQVRTVEYVADENGFHPQLSHPVQNTKAVDLATQRHLELYNKIAEQNSNPDYVHTASAPEDLYPQSSHSVKNTEAVNLATQRHFELYNKIAERNSHANAAGAPKDTASVAYAKQKHLSLFEKIAAEHARLGEEQLAQRLAFEATSIRNEEEDSNYHQ